jgi:Fe-S cluster biosynthesis and repair protein YggX
MAEERIVHCVKLGKDLPGLAKPPVPGELGQMIYEKVSKEAFKNFMDYFRIIVNEYRIDLTSPDSDKIFTDHMKEYFFGKGGKVPEQFSPGK